MIYLYSAGGTNRPRAYILVGSMTSWTLPVYFEGGVERRLVVCSGYLPYDSEDHPTIKEFEEPVRYCEDEHLYLIMWCDSNAHQSAWVATT
jgi:hypothetical protein